MRRATTFELFRAAVWVLINYNDRLARLEEEDPRFSDCPAFCSRPEADMRRGCPDCPVSIMYAEAREEAAEEFGKIAERRGFDSSHVWAWTFDALKRDVDGAAQLDAAHPEGVNPLWNVRQRALVNHLRGLRALFRRLEAKRISDEIRSKVHG